MPRMSKIALGIALAAAAWRTPAASAATVPAAELSARVAPSLVVVQYVFQNELGRHELKSGAIVVADDGLVMAPLTMFPMAMPDDQMKEFKILLPRPNADAEEVEAVFQGRDPRTNTAFIRAKKPQHWKAIHFVDGTENVGDPVYSVGLLPEVLNYKSYFTEAVVSASLDADVPQVLVTGGGLATPGSPVFDGQGRAVGIVSSVLATDRDALAFIANAPKLFTPSRDFLPGIENPPTPEKPIEMPWMGVSQMTGVTKDLAEVLGVSNQPAVQVGDVVPDAPADKAGLKAGDVIVKLDGKPLPRGDESTAELPAILTRRMQRLKPGDKVTFSVLREKGQPLKDIEVTLGKEPKGVNLAKRFFADDLGFVARELVFTDLYRLKLPNDQKGVIVSLMRPEAAAQNGGLKMNDVITRIDNESVTDIDNFKKTYQTIRKDKPQAAIVLEVRRGDREDTVRIEPPQQ